LVAIFLFFKSPQRESGKRANFIKIRPFPALKKTIGKFILKIHLPSKILIDEETNLLYIQTIFIKMDGRIA